MSNEKNALPTEEKTLKSKTRKNSIKNSFEETFAESSKKLATEQNIPQADFIEQKSSKEYRKKVVKTRIFGIQQDDYIGKRQKLYKRLFSIFFIVLWSEFWLLPLIGTFLLRIGISRRGKPLAKYLKTAGSI